MGIGRAHATQLSLGVRSTRHRPWPLVVRRARADDQQAVLGFATRTWNDWDYVPQAWPRWLDAPDGVLLVGVPGATGTGEPPLDAQGQALEVGRPIAIVRVALVAPGEAWLEAIRVDPRVRGMDIATDLQVAELHWADAQRASVVRYATSARNEASHRLGARGGFELLTTLRGHWWSATGDPEDDDRGESGFAPHVQAAATARRARLLDRLAGNGLVAAIGEGGSVWAALAGDPGFRAAAGMYEPRPWALEELTRSKFERHLRRGEVIRLTTGEGRASAILVRQQPPAEDAALRVAVLSGDGSDALALVEKVRGLAGESIRFRVAADASPVSGHETAFREAGYVFPEWALHILWRALDAGHPAPPVDPAALVLGDAPEQVLVPPD